MTGARALTCVPSPSWPGRVAAPATDSAADGQCARMRAAAGDGCKRGQADDVDRRGPLRHRVVAELAVAVESPASEAAADARARVQTSGDDDRHAAHARRRRRGRDAACPALPSPTCPYVLSPQHLRRAGAQRGARVSVARGDAGHAAGEAGDRPPASAAAMIELSPSCPIVVPAPALDAAADQRATVILAHGDRGNAAREADARRPASAAASSYRRPAGRIRSSPST